MWNKLDEVLGAAMLTGTAMLAMVLGYDSGVAQACISGVVALLAVQTIKKKKDE